MDLGAYDDTRPGRAYKGAHRWWQPSVEDYYSPFDPHFDLIDDCDDSDSEEDENTVLATRGAFANLSPELLIKLSTFLDLESLCNISSLSRSLKKSFDSPQLWATRIQSCLSLPLSQLADISDKKHWFLYQMCIAPHRRDFKSMTIADRKELEFEEKLLFNKISYNSWALPLRLLHSPLQDNVTVFLLILQSILIFCKLEGQIQAWPWVAVFAPVWIFDVIYFCCCVIWFYFLAKSLMPHEYAEICLSGWLKDVLEAVQLGHSWLDYLLFTIASANSFLFFPLLLILQLDVFSGLYFIGSGPGSTNSTHSPLIESLGEVGGLVLDFRSFHLPWSAVFSPLTVACLIVLHMLNKRYHFCRRNRRYYRLGIAIFLFCITICAAFFTVFIGLHLDGILLPTWWNWWHTAIPLWVAAGTGMIMIGGGFDLTERTNWWRRLQNTPYSMTRAPLIGLLVTFIAVLIYRVEAPKQGIFVEPSLLFPFSFLFGLESVLVLYWIQDLIDFGGYQQYAIRKRFTFSLHRKLAPANDDDLLPDEPFIQM
jgi:hypothetical protein